jgi:hypothetical protein
LEFTPPAPAEINGRTRAPGEVIAKDECRGEGVGRADVLVERHRRVELAGNWQIASASLLAFITWRVN